MAPDARLAVCLNTTGAIECINSHWCWPNTSYRRYRTH